MRRLRLGGRWVLGLGEGLRSLRGVVSCEARDSAPSGRTPVARTMPNIKEISYKTDDVTCDVMSPRKPRQLPKQEPLFRGVPSWTSEFLDRWLETGRKRQNSDVATLASRLRGVEPFLRSLAPWERAQRQRHSRSLPCFFCPCPPTTPASRGATLPSGRGLLRGSGLSALGAHAGGAHYAKYKRN